MHGAFSDTCVSTAFNSVSSDSKFLLRILAAVRNPAVSARVSPDIATHDPAFGQIWGQATYACVIRLAFPDKPALVAAPGNSYCQCGLSGRRW